MQSRKNELWDALEIKYFVTGVDCEVKIIYIRWGEKNGSNIPYIRIGWM